MMMIMIMNHDNDDDADFLRLMMHIVTLETKMFFGG